jgi:hypothetical protein
MAYVKISQLVREKSLVAGYTENVRNSSGISKGVLKGDIWQFESY